MSASKLIGIILSLFVLALALRLGAGVALKMDAPLSEDEPEYFNAARSIAQGRGYQLVPQQSTDAVPRPTAYRVPGTALILAGVFTVTHDSIFVARAVSIVMASLAAPLMFLFARRFVPTPAAIIAGAACALYPTFIFVSRQILSEPYFVPLFLLALLLTAIAYESKNLRSWLLAGLMWGACAMVRPHAAPMAFLIAVYVFLRLGWRPALVMGCGVMMLIIPWVIRNQIVFHKTIFFANESGETLLGSNNRYVLDDPSLHGMWIPPMRVPEYVVALMPIRGEVERNKEQSRIAMDYLKANPQQIPRLAVYKLMRWLTPVTVSGGKGRLLVLGSYGVLLLLLAMGLRFGIYGGTFPFHMTLLCTSVLFLITLVFWGNLTRGRLPLEVLWMPWGAWSAWTLARRVMRWNRTALPVRQGDNMAATTR